MSDLEHGSEEVIEAPEDVAVEDQVDGEDVAVQESETPEYTPNYTYRVKDEEFELPEAVRPYIKDADSEKFFRDMVERAHGLDHVKQDRTELRSQLGQLSERVQQFENHYQTAEKFKQAGDWDSYFEYMQIPPQVLMQQTKKLLNVYDPENPQAQVQYQQRRQQHWEHIQDQQRAQQLEQTLTQQRVREVDMVMTYRPDVQETAREFDQRMGRQGAFREEVVNRGRYVWQTQGRDLSADEATNEVLMLMGKAPTNQQNGYQPHPAAYAPSPGQQYAGQQAPQQGGYQQVAGQPPAPTPPAQPVAQARPPVIPNIEGGGSSGAPVRRPAVNSLEDIHKRRLELQQGIGR